MPVSRYDKNKIIINRQQEYSKILTDRGVNQIDHFSFEKFKNLKIRDIQGIDIVRHTWKSSDRFFKLASIYYNDPTYWWIIAYFNNAPLETDLNVGDVLSIPIPLSYILSAMDY
tara:strand:+ start:55 stop:396 length:342 start_codon:yes stop_codon:yes gene_type:complete